MDIAEYTSQLLDIDDANRTFYTVIISLMPRDIGRQNIEKYSMIFLGARAPLGLLYVKVKVKKAKMFWNSRSISVLLESNKIVKDS